MIHVIGGAGFIGSRLTQRFDKQKRPYRVFDKALSGAQYLDVTDKSSFENLPPAETIINLAAEHRDNVRPAYLYDQVNVEGARNLCSHCTTTGVRHLIFTSSVAVYGLASEQTGEDGALKPSNEYGRTKLEAEEVYREWHARDPITRSLTIIRPTVVFGEGNRGNVFNLFLQIAANRFIMVGSGENKKSMAYVGNVAEFLDFCIRFNTGSHVYNYVDSPDMDMNALVTKCRQILLKKSGVGLRIPTWAGLTIGHIFDFLSASMKWQAPISSVRVKKFTSTSSFTTAASKIGFIPSVDLGQAVDQTLRYEFPEHCGIESEHF